MRIENKHGGGVPDVHMVWDGLPFWCELKVSKGNAVKLTPHQVAWNMAYWARGGSNFFLVKSLKDSDLILFEGDQGADLINGGYPWRVVSGSRILRPCSAPCALFWNLECLAPCALRLDFMYVYIIPGKR